MAETVYYPALAVNFTLRFDEALLKEASPSGRSVADVARSAGGAAGLMSSKPSALSGAGSRLSKRLGTVPRQCSVELPGYRQAGKFSLNLAFRDFPVDPRALRAVGVEIYIGTVSSADFQRSMLQQDKDYGQLAGILSADPANLRFVGIVDTATTTYSDSGSEVAMEGRDLRGIFLDARLAPEVLSKLDMRQDIGGLVRQLLSYVPLADKIPVEVAPASDWPGNVIPRVASESVVTRVNKGARGTKAARPSKGSTDSLVFWDLVTQFCFLVGAIPYFEGHTLWIRPLQTLYDRKRSTAAPFKNNQPRTVATSNGQEQFNYRRMIYGRNLASLKFERKIGGTAKVPTIRCVSNATDSEARGADRILEVTWPDPGALGTNADLAGAASATDVSPSGDDAKQEVLTIPIPGIKDKDRLRDIAQALYEEIGRSEMGGSASSKELASFGGNNEDADILRLRPGEPVAFLVDALGLQGIPPVVSELNLLASKSHAEAVEAVAKRLGGDKDLAEVLVGTLRGSFQRLQDTFRVDTVKFGWDIQTGLAVDFDFKNYVEARYDVAPTDTSIDTTVDNVIRIAENAAERVRRGSVRVPETAASLAEKLRKQNREGR